MISKKARKNIRKRKYEFNKYKKIMKYLSKKRRKTKIHKEYNNVTKTGKYTYNKVMEFLKMKKFSYKTKKGGKKKTLKIPKVFCFSRNPDETINKIKILAGYLVNKTTEEIFIDHTECEQLGMCASLVMDAIITEALKVRHRPIHINGKLSEKSEYVNDILRESGIVKHLGFKSTKKNNIKVLEWIVNGESDKVGEKVSEYFESCLKTQKLMLKPEGFNLLAEMIGEVVLNCRDHGGKYATWYTAGHYNLYKDESYGEFHLVIFNFGQTIYEGLKSKETSEEMKENLNNITKKHIGFFKGNWDEETLWTLYALQSGVSRFKTRIKRSEDTRYTPTRGTGTIRLINDFQKIGTYNHNEKPIMSITSGNAHIYFDGKYRLKEETLYNDTKADIIAFNKENDLNIPPNKEYVHRIKEYFPGTIISMKFYINREKYIEEDKNEK